jgi:tetratricopeptide (TPR) repeat protein
MENFRAALEWALIERGDVLLGQRLTCELSAWPSFRYSGARRWIAAALDLVDEQTPTNIFADLTFKAGEISTGTTARQFERELADSERALKLYRALGDSGGVVKAQNNIAHALIYLGRRAEAKALLDANVLLARQLDRAERNRYLPFSLRFLAIASEHQIDAARAYIAEALQINKVVGGGLEVAGTLLDLGECEFGAGNVEVALRQALDAVAALTTEKRPAAFAQSDAFNQISLYLTTLGRYTEAKAYACRALAIAREHCFDADAVSSLENIAAITALEQGPIVDGSRNRCD